MPVPSKMSDLLTLAASNSPSGSDLIGNTLDDYIRSHAAIIRSTNALSSASIAAASTVDLSTSDGEQVTITGAATINSLGTVTSGIIRELSFQGACTLTNSSAIVLPFGSSITTAAGDIFTFRSLGAGNWVMVSGTKPQGALMLTGGTLTGVLNINYAGSQGLSLSQGTTASTSVKLANTISGGVSWEIGSSGGAIGVAGHVYIRNQGTSSNVFDMDPGGNVVVTGALTANSLNTAGNVVSTSSALALAPTGAGTIYLKPNGPSSSTNQGQYSSAGQLSVVTIATSADDSTFSSQGPFKFGFSGGPVYFHGAGGAGDNVLNFNRIGSSNYNFTFFGTCSATDFVATSDARLKNIIGNYGGGWHELKGIEIKEYDKYDHARSHAVREVGLIAQQLQTVLPTAVKESNEGHLSVSTLQVLALAIKAIQDIGNALEREGIL